MRGFQRFDVDVFFLIFIGHEEFKEFQRFVSSGPRSSSRRWIEIRMRRSTSRTGLREFERVSLSESHGRKG